MILLVAYGNPLRCDDGFAWHVARHFQNLVSNIEVITLHQLGPELAERIGRCEGVIFVDARRGEPPGEINHAVLCPKATRPAFTHHLLPEHLLDYARALYGQCCPRAILVSVSGEHFEYGESLSPRVAGAVPRVVCQIRKLIDLWTAESSKPSGPTAEAYA